jgi:multiple sugar transport system substrate-binding protein
LPLEEVFGSDVIATIGASTIGPSMASYCVGDRHWALPLDAASQVMAVRSGSLGQPVPATWDEVLQLSRMTHKVALSLAGPHAFLSLLSIATAFGEPPAEKDANVLMSTDIGIAVYELMADLASRSPQSVRALNPISILAHMAAHEDIVLCPLIYGYVNYAAPKSGHHICFHDAPRATPGGRLGSTLGGTGIGISTLCDVTPALKRHLLWLMGEDAQTRFIPDHDGQPSLRAAWYDSAVNKRWGNFYANTAATLETAYVRPRHNGYIAFQGWASEVLRNAFDEKRPAHQVVQQLQTAYRANRSSA